MDKKYLAEIKAREQAATPGKWYVVPNDEGNYSVFTDVNGIPCKIGETYLRHDAEVAAHARTDIPELIAEVERQDQQIATLERALEYACADRATTPSMWQDLQKKYMEIAHQAQEQEGKK